jgi:hypothetical protein
VLAGLIAARSAGASGDTAERAATILAIPFLGASYARLFRPETYHVADTTALFKLTVQQAACELGILQVLCQLVDAPSGGDASVAVHTKEGEPFFEDGKDLTKLANGVLLQTL